MPQRRALSIRRQGVYFVMLTLAFAQLFYFLAYTFSDITGGDNGLTGVPRRGIGPLTLNSSWSYYAFVAIIFLVSFAALQRIATSTFGRQTRYWRRRVRRSCARRASARL